MLFRDVCPWCNTTRAAPSDPTARFIFCAECGSTTEYKADGAIQDWNDAKINVPTKLNIKGEIVRLDDDTLTFLVVGEKTVGLLLKDLRRLLFDSKKDFNPLNIMPIRFGISTTNTTYKVTLKSFTISAVKGRFQYYVSFTILDRVNMRSKLKKETFNPYPI